MKLYKTIDGVRKMLTFDGAKRGFNTMSAGKIEKFYYCDGDPKALLIILHPTEILSDWIVHEGGKMELFDEVFNIRNLHVEAKFHVLGKAIITYDEDYYED